MTKPTKKIHYDQAYDNEWILPLKKSYRMCCCDCNLVHQMDFRIKGKDVEYRARRDKKETARLRRRAGGPQAGPLLTRYGFRR